MKIKFSLAVAAAAFIMPGAINTASAQEQVIETMVCQSTPGTRASCPVSGEIISAGIQRQVGEGTPCFLGYTWGFEENGIWTGNGCSAEFAVTVERAAAQPVVDPEVLQKRLRNTRKRLRQTRRELVKEQEGRRALEAELADAQAALREAEAAAPNVVKRKRKRNPQMAIRAVSVCSNTAIRRATKSGATKARILEIVSARPTQGSWLVIGRMMSELNGQRSQDYFRCWSEKGKVISYDNTM
jgi:hypothetical protein